MNNLIKKEKKFFMGKPYIFDKKINQDMVTSYHEAGHVKYCLDFDIYFRDATILPKNGYGGVLHEIDHNGVNVETDYTWSDNQQKELYIMTLAGLICEAKYSGKISMEGSFTEMGDIILDYAPENEIIALEAIDYIIEYLRNIKSWDKIKAIAEYLYKKKTATRSELLKFRK